MAASTILIIVLAILILALIGGVISIYNGLITVSCPEILEEYRCRPPAEE